MAAKKKATKKATKKAGKKATRKATKKKVSRKATKKKATKKKATKKKAPAKKATKKKAAAKKAPRKSPAKKTSKPAPAEDLNLITLSIPDQPSDYDLVSGSSPEELISVVRSKLYVQHDGSAWIPLGAAFEEDDRWYQTMALYT